MVDIRLFMVVEKHFCDCSISGARGFKQRLLLLVVFRIDVCSLVK